MYGNGEKWNALAVCGGFVRLREHTLIQALIALTYIIVRFYFVLLFNGSLYFSLIYLFAFCLNA